MQSFLNTYFDKIYCINLDRRKDRWIEMEKFFDANNIKIERYSAVDGNPMGFDSSKLVCGKPEAFHGIAGCVASHLNIWKLAKEKNYKRVLIIEDDSDFIPNFNELFKDLISEVPEEWDLLYFGSMHETHNINFPEKITEKVVKAKRIITTTCYAIKDTIYDLAINSISFDLPFIYKPIDVYLADDIQPKCNTYAFHPPVAWQRASYSDIQNGKRDYSNMMRYKNIK